MAIVLTEIEKDMFSILWFGVFWVLKKSGGVGVEGKTGENDIVCVLYVWISWKNYKLTSIRKSELDRHRTLFVFNLKLFIDLKKICTHCKYICE